MTARAFAIDLAVLTYLNEKDGAATLETIIHAAVQNKFRQANEIAPSIDEMDQAFTRLNTKRWLIGLPSAVRGVMKWTINDNGRIGLIQMNNE